MSLNEIIFQFNNNKGEMIFPEDKVEANLYGKKILDSLYFIKSNLFLKDDIVVQSKSKVDGILLDYNLVGNVYYQSKISNYGFSTSKNRTDIELIKEEHTESKAKKGQINKISLIIKKDFIYENLPKCTKNDYILNALEKNLYPELLSSHNTDFKTNKILNEIYNLDIHNEKLKELFLQSKVLELLYYEFYQLFKEENFSKKMIKFDEKDIQSLYKAKELIFALEKDYTITTLAKKVALNEFKLKYGFKQLFNTSPGNMILEQKMLKAKKMLETSEYSIAEISNFVGYKHQQSFTNAFIHFFGIRPKDVMKTRSYYY
ncbi:MAG: AraC family transcriptional regulator [Arcobacteraceae bacterium]|nr:AraC family transcriptional regulator [Arcobacteraceae bacterium]